MRRTTKGHVCKDAVACKRRLSLTVSQLIDSEELDRFARHGEELERHAGGTDPLLALRALRELHEDTTKMAGDIVGKAAAETHLTQKELAQALGVPASMLRGLRA